jgi:hypothetical protein
MRNLPLISFSVLAIPVFAQTAKEKIHHWLQERKLPRPAG